MSKTKQISPDQIAESKKMIEANNKERTDRFISELKALRERFPDIEISFGFVDESAVMARILQELRNAPRDMFLTIK